MSTLVKAFSKVCEKSCRMLNQLLLTHIAVAAVSESHHSLLHCMSWKAEHVLLLLANDKMCEALSRVKLCSGGLSNFLSLPITPRMFFFAKQKNNNLSRCPAAIYVHSLWSSIYHNSTVCFAASITIPLSLLYSMYHNSTICFCCCYQNSTFSLSSKYHNSTLSLSSKYQNSTFVLSSKYPNSILSLSSKYHNSTLSLSSMYFSLCLVFLLFSFLFLCQALFFRA
jgi:hypothetical protein